MSDLVCLNPIEGATAFRFTNVDVIYYKLQNFAWTHQTIINLIYIIAMCVDFKSQDSVSIYTTAR